MTPNENIKRQRELAGTIADIATESPGASWFETEPETTAAVASYAAELAALVIELDDWRRSRGMLPYGSPFVYIVERSGEPDVYADRQDAEEAIDILGADENNIALVIEETIFQSSRDHPSTREWLDELRADNDPDYGEGDTDTEEDARFRAKMQADDGAS